MLGELNDLSGMLAAAGPVVGPVLSRVLGNVTAGLTQPITSEAGNRLRSLFRQKRNHDLERAICEASGQAVNSLIARAVWRDIDRTHLRQLAKEIDVLFDPASDEFPVNVLAAVLFDDDAALETALWSVVGPWIDVRKPAFRDRDVLKREFARTLRSAFGETLKEAKHERAFVAYVRSLLQETHRLAKEQANATGEQRAGLVEVLSRLDALMRDDGLLTQVTRVTAEILSGIERLESEASDLRVFVEASLVDRRDRLERIERALNRRLADVYAGVAVAEQVEEIAAELTRFFVTRADDLQRLDEFVAGDEGGVLVVTAPAGFGKSTLLANWTARRRNEGVFTAYHIFSRRSDETRPVAHGFRNLLRQLYVYYQIADESLPIDETSLRDIIGPLIRERGPRPGEPLVIVIDGLDEAEAPFSPPWGGTLPAGVSVIVAVRASAGFEPEHLERWPVNRRRLMLDRMSRADIAVWLRRAGDDEVAASADDPAFVARVAERTEGFPLYLRFLIGDLVETARAGGDLAAALSTTPKGLGAYASDRLRELARTGVLKPEIEELFALLAVAEGPLSADDVRELTGLTVMRLLGLPWQVTRWFTISDADQTYAFAHPLLGDEFERVLGAQARQALDKLIAYCADWQRHRSPYALRHYATHLRLTGQEQDLITLVRTEPFPRTLAEVFPREPMLPLGAIELALEIVIDNGESAAATTATLLLTHARWLRRALSSSPLDTLRTGDAVKAKHLVNLMPVEQRIIWYFILAWESLDDRGVYWSTRTTTCSRTRALGNHRAFHFVG